jgi:hypothetical protein
MKGSSAIVASAMALGLLGCTRPLPAPRVEAPSGRDDVGPPPVPAAREQPHEVATAQEQPPEVPTAEEQPPEVTTPPDEAAGEPFIAPWLLGAWTGGPLIVRTGPDTVRLAYYGGNTYDERVVVVGDVVEFHGTFDGTPSLMKWRKLDDDTAEYFYHFFDGQEYPAKSTLFKVSE